MSPDTGLARRAPGRGTGVPRNESRRLGSQTRARPSPGMKRAVTAASMQPAGTLAAQPDLTMKTRHLTQLVRGTLPAGIAAPRSPSASLARGNRTHALCGFTSASVLLAAPGFALAQAAANLPAAADTIFVTATRTAQPLATALESAIVITRAQIERSGPVTLAELLQAHANVEIRATGGAGQPSGVFMRGANTNHTLILVDGLRVGSSTLGSTAIENIPVDMIERIEVVKGPFSGVYGSDAIGGVIQIFTRRDAKPLFYANTGIGSQSTRDVNAGFSTAAGQTRASLHAGVHETDALSATNSTAAFVFNPDRDPYRNVHGNLRVEQSFRNGETIALSAFQSQGRTRFDSGPDSNDLNRQTLSGYQLVSSNRFANNWASRLTLGRGSDDQRISGAFPSTFKTTQDQATWLNEFKTPTGTMTAGVDFLNEKVSGSTAYAVSERKTRAAFVGDVERIGPQQVDVSLRRDEEDQFGARNTGSLSYGWYFSPSVLAYARGGRAFRAPSFNDLYFPADPQFGPSSNPRLLPEKSDSTEVGLRYLTPALSASVVGFDQKIDDLVVFVFGSGPQNLRKARIKGVEATLATHVYGFDIKGALTRQRPRDEDTGTQLRGRAEGFGSVSAARSWGAWQVSTTVLGNGARYDSTDQANGTRMGGYGLVTAQVRYAIDKRWRVELTGNNVFNKKYELAQGYNTPGRVLFLNVRFEAR